MSASDYTIFRQYIYIYIYIYIYVCVCVCVCVCSYSINWLYPVSHEFVSVTTAGLHYNLSNFFLDQGSAVTPVALSEFIEEGDRKLSV